MIVVVGREDQAIAWQRENLLRDRVIERGGVTVRKSVRPQPSISMASPEGAENAGLLNKVGVVGVGMPRRKQRLKGERADRQRLVLGDPNVSTGKAVHGGVRDLGAGQAAQIAGRCDVVRMHMRLQRISQFEIQFLKCRQVAFDRLQDRIDQDWLCASRAGEEIGVGRGLGSKS
jgi:hypothetical protein